MILVLGGRVTVDHWVNCGKMGMGTGFTGDMVSAAGSN